MRIADDLDIEIRLFLALALGAILRRFILIDVTTGGHPTTKPFVPEEECPLPRVDDERGGSEMTVHEREGKDKKEGKDGKDRKDLLDRCAQFL